MAKLTLAYPLKNSEVHDRELELSMLSMLRFFQGYLDVLVVGDRPHFPLPQQARFIKAPCGEEALEDALKKIEIINREVRTEEYIYCHDDIFAVNEFKREDLETVLYTHLRKIEDWDHDQVWAQTKRYSGEMLNARDVFDTATHMPRLFDRNKVEATLGFGGRVSNGKPWDFQIIYDHLFTPHANLQRTGDFGKFLRFESPLPVDVLDNMFENQLFVNTGSGAFDQAVIDAMMKRLDNQSDQKLPPGIAQRNFAKPKASLSIYDKCKHRGGETGEFGECGTCVSLTQKVPIFYCGVHKQASTKPLKKPNELYGRPMNCIECWSEQKGHELPGEENASENDSGKLRVQPTTTVD